MASQALADILQRVDGLTPAEQRLLLEYLIDNLTAPTPTKRSIIRLGGVLGALDIPPDQDPIADTLEELRRERAAQLDG